MVYTALGYAVGILAYVLFSPWILLWYLVEKVRSVCI